MSSSTAAPVAVEYPDSDGKPLAESDFQFGYLAYARERLRGSAGCRAGGQAARPRFR